MWRRPQGPSGPPMPWRLGTGAHLPARMSRPACLFSRGSGTAFPTQGGGLGEALGSGYSPPPPPSGDTAHSPPLQVIYSGRWAASSSLAARDQTDWSCGEGVNAFAWAVATAPPPPTPERGTEKRRGPGGASQPGLIFQWPGQPCPEPVPDGTRGS